MAEPTDYNTPEVIASLMHGAAGTLRLSARKIERTTDRHERAGHYSHAQMIRDVARARCEAARQIDLAADALATPTTETPGGDR